MVDEPYGAGTIVLVVLHGLEVAYMLFAIVAFVRQRSFRMFE